MHKKRLRISSWLENKERKSWDSNISNNWKSFGLRKIWVSVFGSKKENSKFLWTTRKQNWNKQVENICVNVKIIGQEIDRWHFVKRERNSFWCKGPVEGKVSLQQAKWACWNSGRATAIFFIEKHYTTFVQKQTEQKDERLNICDKLTTFDCLASVGLEIRHYVKWI